MNMETEGAAKAEKKKTKCLYPALVLLAGSDFQSYDSNGLILRILQSIGEAIAANPDMILCGRTIDQFRINFHNRYEVLPSIRSRMSALLAYSMNYAALDVLLSPLLASNPDAFQIKAEELNAAHQLKKGEFNTQSYSNKTLLREIQPFTWAKRYRILSTILDLTRKRFKYDLPQSNLLRNPMDLLGVIDAQEAERIRAWSLYSTEMGLAVRLGECFRDRYRTSAEYDDLVERTLYCFKISNPIPGVKPKRVLQQWRVCNGKAGEGDGDGEEWLIDFSGDD